MMRIAKAILIFMASSFVGVILHGWSALALYYCSFPSHPTLRIVAALVYLAAVLAIIIANPRHVRAFFLSLAGFVLVALWFGTIRPQPGGHFPPELTLPRVEFNGDKVTIHDVRDCHYRSQTDLDVRYEPRTYDLKDLRTMDVMVNYWGMDAIAHTFLAYGFADGTYLDVSVEIRPRVGQAYDMLQGFFKQYQIIYIWGDERDLIRLRTNIKKETVYLYRAALKPEEVRRMFLSMLKTTDDLHRQPQFYNTLTHSCTNTLGNHLIATGIRRIPIWKRRFLTGDVDRRLYHDGMLETWGLPFPELRRQANIDERAIAADEAADLSRRIRTHVGRGAR